MKLPTTLLSVPLLISGAAWAELPQPPLAEVRPHTVSSPHGDRVDPYYWLRDDARSSPEVIAYLEAENAYALAFQASYQPLVEKLTQELIGRMPQDDSSVPYVMGDYLYSSRYEAGKEHPIYVRTPVAGGDEQIMLDVNVLAEGHDYFVVSNWSVSPDQTKLAYLEDTTGRRQYQLRIKDLTTGTLLDDSMTGLSSSLAWSADSKHLFVVENDPVTLLSTKVYRHQLGKPVAERALVYQEHDNSFFMGVGNTRDRNFVVIGVSSTVSNEFHVLDASKPEGAFQVVAPRQRDFKYSVDHIAGRWIISTDWDAPNNRMMTVGQEKLGNRDHWQELIAHDEQVFI
ncbi:MAG: S9 family peptidase, partial [Alkalimonas sp.]|nr:S9 family peptidase [Alkalimonas sp.]